MSIFFFAVYTETTLFAWVIIIHGIVNGTRILTMSYEDFDREYNWKLFCCKDKRCD